MGPTRNFDYGSLPPIRLLIWTLRPKLITRVLQRGAPMGTPSRIGTHLVPCYGFMENVHIPSPSVLIATNESWIGSWLWEDHSQVRYPSPGRVAS